MVKRDHDRAVEFLLGLIMAGGGILLIRSGVSLAMKAIEGTSKSKQDVIDDIF